MCVVNKEGDLAECEGLRCHTLPYCPSHQWLNDARDATPSSDHQEVGALLAHTKALLLVHALKCSRLLQPRTQCGRFVV